MLKWHMAHYFIFFAYSYSIVVSWVSQFLSAFQPFPNDGHPMFIKYDARETWHLKCKCKYVLVKVIYACEHIFFLKINGVDKLQVFQRIGTNLSIHKTFHLKRFAIYSHDDLVLS